MTLQSLTRQFDNVNVTGRLSQRYLTGSGLLDYAVDQTVRHRNVTGIQAFGSRVAVNACVTAALSLSADRMMLPLQAIDFARSRRFVSGLFPAAELAVGRGTRAPEARPVPAGVVETVDYAWCVAARYGVLGAALELLPMRLAVLAQARGANKLAQACVAAAIVGRCALQLPRAVVAVWACCETALFVGLFTGIVLAIEGTARALRWAIVSASASPPQQAPGRVHGFLDAIIDQLSRRAVHTLDTVVRPDALGEQVPARGPISHQDVADRTNVAMRRFLLIDDPDFDGGRRVREVADGIARDLRRYCANAADNAALRGGLALLNNMMELTYEDANWPKPAELG